MFERMLVGGIENRITVGILSFVAMMVILGWAAINEGGRMQAFEQMEAARSIEQGAKLFASNCTRCHGTDGRGTVLAPGLNNPQLFGHDFFPDITQAVKDLSAERSALAAEKSDLTGERDNPDTSDARREEIAARLTEVDARTAELQTEIEAKNIERETQVQQAVDKGYNPAEFSRLEQLKWVGTHESFVLTTLIHGRPISAGYWPEAMPAWSQRAGGPLRDDQLEDLVAYIENWDKGEDWTLDDLFAVNRFAITPVDPSLYAGIDLPDAIGTDVDAIVEQVAQMTGDPARGEVLYHNQARSELNQLLGCSTCHLQETNGAGPMANGTFARIQNERLTLPEFAGYAPEKYLVESIVNPAKFVVSGFAEVMSANQFGTKLSLQDIADLIAYLETLQ
jgi:mono/diheme cytochrome c family protein